MDRGNDVGAVATQTGALVTGLESLNTLLCARPQKCVKVVFKTSEILM